jgi:hypothetical protein
MATLKVVVMVGATGDSVGGTLKVIVVGAASW